MPYISGGMHAGSAKRRREAAERKRRAERAADFRRREKYLAQQEQIEKQAQKQAQLQQEAKILQAKEAERRRLDEIKIQENINRLKEENQASQEKFLSTVKTKIDLWSFQFTVKSVERRVFVKNKELQYAQVLLYLGINDRDYNLIDEALEKKANINDTYFFPNSPLNSAVEKCDIKLIEYLWARKADLHLTDQYNNYPFFQAIKTRSSDVFNWFAEKETNATNLRDKEGLTALHHAADANNEIAMRYLLTHQADVNAVDNRGWTPIQYACHSDNFKCLDLLMEHGAKLIMSRQYQTRVHLERMFMFAVKNSKYEMISDLLCSSMIADASFDFLLMAIKQSNYQLFSAILKSGFSPYEINQTKNDNTLLVEAIKQNCMPIISALIDDGADPALQRDKWEALLTEKPNAEIRKYLTTILLKRELLSYKEKTLAENPGCFWNCSSRAPIKRARAADALSTVLEHKSDASVLANFNKQFMVDAQLMSMKRQYETFIKPVEEKQIRSASL